MQAVPVAHVGGVQLVAQPSCLHGEFLDGDRRGEFGQVPGGVGEVVGGDILGGGAEPSADDVGLLDRHMPRGQTRAHRREPRVGIHGEQFSDAHHRDGIPFRDIRDLLHEVLGRAGPEPLRQPTEARFGPRPMLHLGRKRREGRLDLAPQFPELASAREQRLVIERARVHLEPRGDGGGGGHTSMIPTFERMF